MSFHSHANKTHFHMKGYTPREAHDNSEMAYFILATSYNHVVFNSIEHNVQSVALVADLYLL